MLHGPEGSTVVSLKKCHRGLKLLDNCFGRPAGDCSGTLGFTQALSSTDAEWMEDIF